MKASYGWTFGLGLAALAALVAANAARTPQAGPEATAAIAAPAAVPPGRLQLPYLGKPRAPVSVRVTEAGRLHAGVPSSLRLEVTSRADVSNIALVLDEEGGLVSDRPRRAIGALRRGARESLDLRVTPASGGEQRLAGRLEFTLDGARMATPVSLPVTVAGPATSIPSRSKSDREPVRDATGEWVYALPAQ